jgi:hypothetical protein
MSRKRGNRNACRYTSFLDLQKAGPIISAPTSVFNSGSSYLSLRRVRSPCIYGRMLWCWDRKVPLVSVGGECSTQTAEIFENKKSEEGNENASNG